MKRYLHGIELEWDRVPDRSVYPFSLPIVKALESLELHPRVTFLVGENGSGKSTLLEAIAVAFGFNAEGGSRNFRFETRASHSPLHQYLRLVRGLPPRDAYFLRAESYSNVATNIEVVDRETLAENPRTQSPPIINSYGGRSLHEQSHGESFLTLFVERFSGHGLYLLDEPEAALSPTRQMAFLTRLHDLVAAESQLVIATHSPIILAYPDAQILQLGSGRFVQVGYRETESYRLTREFLNRPDAMLEILLAQPKAKTTRAPKRGTRPKKS